MPLCLLLPLLLISRCKCNQHTHIIRCFQTARNDKRDPEQSRAGPESRDGGTHALGGGFDDIDDTHSSSAGVGGQDGSQERRSRSHVHRLRAGAANKKYERQPQLGRHADEGQADGGWEVCEDHGLEMGDLMLVVH